MTLDSTGQMSRASSERGLTSGGLLHRFDECVALHPEKGAILFKNQEVSYRELKERSLRVATKLKHHGVSLESFVPFCFPKSVHAIVAILAILRCGAAFAAILPSAPLQRKREIIEACGSNVLVCGVDEKIPTEGLCKNQIVLGDDVIGDIAELGEDNETPGVFPIPTNSNAACVLFTSGSTGSKFPPSQFRHCILSH
ncbi:hypothetical protein GGR50DRAFT_630240 [Xylaria sp. CBS 124048]|nr:hypothetical protein GGR50DRAFT_630240 [Xylaria sp. CBS 124048]